MYNMLSISEKVKVMLTLSTMWKYRGDLFGSKNSWNSSNKIVK